jgi:hypothetical protein
MFDAIKLFVVLVILMMPIAVVNELSRAIFGRNMVSVTITIIFIFIYAALMNLLKKRLKQKKGSFFDKNP